MNLSGFTARLLAPAAAVCLFVVGSPAEAKVYKWVDEDGNVHYSARKPVGKEPIRTLDGAERPPDATSKRGPQPFHIRIQGYWMRESQGVGFQLRLDHRGRFERRVRPAGRRHTVLGSRGTWSLEGSYLLFDTERVGSGVAHLPLGERVLVALTKEGRLILQFRHGESVTWEPGRLH
jgi:hypothetical protein